MPTTLPRRRFLQLTGWGTGVAVLARTRPGHAGPKKTKTLLDTGRAADQLSLPPPPGGAGLYHDAYAVY